MNKPKQDPTPSILVCVGLTAWLIGLLLKFIFYAVDIYYSISGFQGISTFLCAAALCCFLLALLVGLQDANRESSVSYLP